MTPWEETHGVLGIFRSVRIMTPKSSAPLQTTGKYYRSKKGNYSGGVLAHVGSIGKFFF